MKRSHTTALTRPRAKSGSLLLPSANYDTAIRSPPSSRFDSQFGYRAAGWNEIAESSSSGLDEDEDTDVADDQEWGLHKDMELFEVSAKDDLGIRNLFDTLIAAIIAKRDVIEEENELKRRDSVYLTPVTVPVWAAQADAEEAREKAQAAAGFSWSCCST